MVWKGTKHTHPIKNEHGFSLLELVVSVGVVLVLIMVGVLSYNNISGSSKQSATQKAANEVYDKAFSALLDGDAETKPEDVAEEYNKNSKNIVTTVEVLPTGRIKVTATLGDDYSAVRETPVSAGSDGNSPIDQPTDGTGENISSNTNKTIMNFQCDSNVNGPLPIINMPGNGKATLVNMSTNEETPLENVENSTEYRTVNDSFVPQTVLTSVSMETGVPYKLTVEVEVDSTISPFNPETSFAIMSLLNESNFGTIGCLTSIDSIGNGIVSISTIMESKLVSVPSTIPSTVTSLQSAFYGAVSFNQDVSSWDVSNVTDMSSMFYSANVFNQDISGWDVSNVTDMSRMFAHAQAFNQDVSGWDVSNVADMSYMFQSARAFNQDISDWDVSNVTDMSYMFHKAEAFNQDISDWDVSNVTTMWYMFNRAYVFNQDISSWDVSNVTNMRSMFYNAEAFNQDISDWKVPKISGTPPLFATGSGIEINKQYHPQWGVG